MANRPWTKSEEDYLRENVLVKSYIEIAFDLKRTYSAVSERARKLKISNHRRWTREEIEYLVNRFGKASNGKIAQALGRTAMAVAGYAKRLGLGAKKDAEGMMTLYGLFHALYPHTSRGNKKLKKYIKNGLPICRYNLSDINPKRKTILVKVDEFWKWAEEHQDMVEFADLEENFLGAEPKWVKEKRKREWMERHNKRWAGKV